MAKARRTIRTEHDDGSATIDLAAPAPETPLEAPAGTKLPDYGSKEAKEAVDKPKAPPRAHRTDRRDVEDSAPSLEDQIRTLRTAEQSARQRAEQERAARIQVEQTRVAEANRARQEVAQSHLDLVSNTLEGQQAALQLAKQEHAAARVSNDPMAETEALDKITKINNKIATLEAGKDEMERQARMPPQQYQQPQQQIPQGPPNIEHVLAQMPALTNEERNWVRAHPDAVTDRGQIQRMQVAYADAERMGIRRNSPEYFQFFEERMGYEPADNVEAEYDDVDNDEPEPVRQQAPVRRGPVTSAPVSRSSPGAAARDAPRSGQVTLTKEEREHAKISGVDERTYAEGKRRLIDLKRKGYYQETG
jgi:hypothetical protein